MTEKRSCTEQKGALINRASALGLEKIFPGPPGEPFNMAFGDVADPRAARHQCESRSRVGARLRRSHLPARGLIARTIRLMSNRRTEPSCAGSWAYSASDRLRSSCSKVLAIRAIPAERAPAALAVSRHVAVTIATSLMIARACGNLRPKNSEAASSRSSEQVPSSRSMFVVSTRTLRSVGTGLRSKAGERDHLAGLEALDHDAPMGLQQITREDFEVVR